MIGEAVISIYFILMFINTVFGLLANFFVVTAVICSQKMHFSAMNLLIANLALADFLLLFYIAINYSHTYIMHTPLLIVAKWVCPAGQFFINVCWAATVSTFVAIAVERWLFILSRCRSCFTPAVLVSGISSLCTH